METSRKLTLKTLDLSYEYDILSVYVYSSKYKKKIKNKEFHAPGPSKIIVETTEKIILWLFKDVIIRSDEYGGVVINSNDNYDEVTQKVPYFSQDEIEKALYLTKLYEAKKNIYISAEETAEYDWARKITELNKVINIVKIPRYIGGGF